MNSNLKIFNSFGITPTTNFTAAGLDFYVPNLNTDEKVHKFIEAISSGNKPRVKYEDLEFIYNTLSLNLEVDNIVISNNDIWNCVQLFISLDSERINYWDASLEERVIAFYNGYLTFDDNMTPGMILSCNDHVLFNSGIKVALDHNTAGIFFNKSGRGNKGFDVRAQVVDEDYTGFVHCSLAYTKESDTQGVIYVGDKITQMVILPIILVDSCNELTEDDYNEIMKDSNRGANAFGSSDEKH